MFLVCATQTPHGHRHRRAGSARRQGQHHQSDLCCQVQPGIAGVHLLVPPRRGHHVPPAYPERRPGRFREVQLLAFVCGRGQRASACAQRSGGSFRWTSGTATTIPRAITHGCLLSAILGSLLASWTLLLQQHSDDSFRRNFDPSDNNSDLLLLLLRWWVMPPKVISTVKEPVPVESARTK